MGFNSVYRSLVEIFPQIDARILKAVAIEHSKDIDAAVDNVLSEVVPYLSKRSIVYSSPPQDQVSKGLSDGEAEHEEQSNQLRRRSVVSRKKECSSSGPNLAVEPVSLTSSTSGDCKTCLDKAPNDSLDANDGNNQLSRNIGSEELILLGKAQENTVGVGVNQISNAISNALVHEDGKNSDLCQVCVDTGTEGSVSLGKSPDANIEFIVGSEQTPYTALVQENGFANCSLTAQCHDCKDFDDPGDDGFDMANHGKGNQVESSSNVTILGVENDVSQLVPSYAQEHASDSPKCYPHSEFCSGSSNAECEKPNGVTASEKGDIEDESTLNTIVTQSGQVCRADLLEAVIEDAKNNKKTLFSAMESVMNMMREVELEEKAAEQAKEEASRGGLHILTKVEELKQMLTHAKEANDMHAGEVYGEKAILATEVRELQTRLLSLADERDTSLAILDEMRETLQARLAAAEEVKKAAEQEKLGKEESAQNALAVQEAIMDKVVKESKILQQEAEENSKLQEFLMDRGRIVDSLQGEISVICEDVRLLKEKFDERVPLSQSFSSSQTSCILASSGSSMKSMASDLVHEQCESPKSLEKRSPTSSICGESPKSRLEMEKTRVDKELLDDGWELFDNDTEQYI